MQSTIFQSKQRAPHQSIQLIIKLIPNMIELTSLTINQRITNKHKLSQTSSSTKCYLFSHGGNSKQTVRKATFRTLVAQVKSFVIYKQINRNRSTQSIWILVPPCQKFAQNLLGTKRSSWLVVHRERLRKRVAECVSLEVGYLRYGAAPLGPVLLWSVV